MLNVEHALVLFAVILLLPWCALSSAVADELLHCFQVYALLSSCVIALFKYNKHVYIV
jgi:uncharacterized MnhB-related membrane protein